MNRKLYVMIAASGAFFVGCAPPPVTQELKSARDAVAAAEASTAAELAPAEVASAKQALERAEKAFADDDKSQETIDYSYVAERTAQIAVSVGQLEKAKRDRKDFKMKLEKLEKTRANMTEEELEAARAALAAQKADLADTSQELEKERELRKAAEGKLTVALASLHEVGQVKEEARGVVITLSGSVLFTTGKHELLPIAKEKLDEVAKALQDQGYKKIVVEGHSDSRGADSTNKDLSLKRAQSVRTHLVSKGIEAGKIEAVGLGEERPVTTNETPEGRANNRRVELIVTAE